MCTCLGKPSLPPSPLSLLLRGTGSRKYPDSWGNSEGLCLYHLEVEGSVRMCVSPAGQSGDNLTLEAAESLEKLGSGGSIFRPDRGWERDDVDAHTAFRGLLWAKPVC